MNSTKIIDTSVFGFLCVSAERGLGLPDILGARFVLHTVVHHGVRVHPDIFCGQGAGAAGHPESTVKAEEGGRKGCEGGGSGRGGRAEPVHHVADDQLHHAAVAGRRAADRVPVAAGHAGQHHATGDRLRLRQRREHQ